jgi:hypothetical protein
MNTYLLVHRHVHNYTGNAGTRAAWQAWFEELGDTLVDPGNAVLRNRATAGGAGTGLPLGGYTIIAAGDLDEATKIAGTCPVLAEGGAVEVGELSPVPGRLHPARTF